MIHTHTTIVTSLNSTASIEGKFVGISGLKPSGIYVYNRILLTLNIPLAATPPPCSNRKWRLVPTNSSQHFMGIIILK